MLDELTIYNLSVKYPNTMDFAKEIEKMSMEYMAERFRDKVNDMLCGESFTQHTLSNYNVPLKVDILTLDNAVSIVNEVFEHLKGEWQ